MAKGDITVNLTVEPEVLEAFAYTTQRLKAAEDRIRELEAQQAASEPVAWALTYPSSYDGSQMIELYQTRKEAEDMGDERTTLVPLYPAPPSAAAMTVTEAMVEAAFVRLYPGCFPEEMQRYHADDIRAALTAALTAASEGASDV